MRDTPIFVGGGEPHQRPSRKEIKKLRDSIMRDPQTRREYYPRVYDTPKTHHCPSIYSTYEYGMLAGRHLAGVHQEGYNFNADVVYKIHQELTYYRYPTYFIQEDLLELMRMTDVASSVDMGMVKWPHNACLLMFPKGSYKIHDDDEIMGISISRSFDVQTMEQQMEAKNAGVDDTNGRMYSPEVTQVLSRILDAEEFDKKEYDTFKKMMEKRMGQPVRFVEGITMAFPYTDGQMSCVSYPIHDGSLQSILNKYSDTYTHYDQEEGLTGSAEDFHETAKNQSVDSVYDRTGGMVTKETAENDIEMMQNLVRLGITMILYMGARQTEWTKEASEKQPKRNKKLKKMGGQSWGCNWLGKKYQGYIKEQEEGSDTSGTGRKIRYHWRKGYCGIRWTGKGRSKAKQVWVMPYPVNKPME